MNPEDYLQMLAMIRHYHLGSGRCASAHLGEGCLGTATDFRDVRGHVRAARYNSGRRAVQACHKYAETFRYWADQYRRALGQDLPDREVDLRAEEACRTRYKEAAA